MSRRDTILIAVLINAGLLIILFATAVTSDKEVAFVAETSAAVIEAQKIPFGDEVDQVLSRYGIVESKVDVLPSTTIAFPTEPVSLPAAPGPAPKKAVTPPQKFVDVTVKRGDSLDKLARQNGTTISAIMKANELSDSRLMVGQVLRMPISTGPKKEVAAAPLDGDNFYTIVSGDNPWVVATKFQIPLDELLQINNLDDERARKLKPGDRIRIR